MHECIFDTDITVYTVKATSFPEGVEAAHQYLHRLVPYSEKRKYFGISRPEGGKLIAYYAGAAELETGELQTHGLPQLLLKKGVYLYKDISDFMQHIPAIGQAFTALLADGRIDPQGACVEWYINKNTCRCMVRLQDNIRQ